MLQYKRLPSKGILNLRDLGGYAIPGGRTKYGVFLRSAVPVELAEGDEQLIRACNVTIDIDFRSQQETDRLPDALVGLDGIQYLHMPMFDEAAAGGALQIKQVDDFDWKKHYLRMADAHGAWYAEVIKAMAQGEGCMLFHCTTGKDRTGMIAALLLSICGVSEEDIVADYCVSEVYLRAMYEVMEDEGGFGGGSIEAPFYRTAPEAMRAFLAHINNKYGGAESFLKIHGASDADIAAIRAKLCE